MSEERIKRIESGCMSARWNEDKEGADYALFCKDGMMLAGADAKSKKEALGIMLKEASKIAEDAYYLCGMIVKELNK